MDQTRGDDRAAYRPADLTGPADASPEPGSNSREPVSLFPEVLHGGQQHRLGSVHAREEKLRGPFSNTALA